MKIPKELAGKEVQKFEDMPIFSKLNICDCGCDYETADLDPYLNIRIFYTQPFNPSMIEEYFEGWRYDYDNELFIYRTTKNHSMNHEYIGVEFEILNTNDYIKNRICIWFTPEHEEDFNNIQTLSDFIDACLNSEIELRWKT